MLQLFKRDFQASFFSVIGWLLYMVITYVLNMPYLLTYLFVIFFFHAFIFYLDHKANINRFLISLPVRKSNIVLTRYIFLIICFIVILVGHVIIDQVAHYGLPYLETSPVNGLTATWLMAMLIGSVAISLPIYYAVKSPNIAAFIQAMLLIGGTYSYVVIKDNPYIDLSKTFTYFLKFIDIQPYLIPIAFSLVCIPLSYLLSVWLFEKREGV